MKIYLLILALLLFALPVSAQTTVTFEWDPHPQAADLLGFKLYQSKQTGTYPSAPVCTFVGGSLTTGQCAKPSSPGKWYWVLTAYVIDVESEYSNEVNLVIRPDKPHIRSVIISALGRAITKAAGLFRGGKNLKIVKVDDES